jgi:hypothetical protein
MAMPAQLARSKREPRSGKNQRRKIVEDLPALDARQLARKKLFPKDWTTRRYDFSIYIPTIDWLVLGPHVAEVLFTTSQKQIIAIRWLYTRGACQGVKAIFECTSCGHQRYKLYYHQGQFRCYRCVNRLGVPFASQQLSRIGRKHLQAQRIRCFLGEHPGCSEVHRPFLTPHKTYNRLINRLRKTEAKLSNHEHKSRYITQRTRKPAVKYHVKMAAFAEA